jgi:hypothetical protein
LFFVRGINFASFYGFDILFWKKSLKIPNGVIRGTVPTVWYVLFFHLSPRAL